MSGRSNPSQPEPKARQTGTERASGGFLTCDAMMRALVVLPVPGGPSNRTARGRLDANCLRVPLAIDSYTSACRQRESGIGLS